MRADVTSHYDGRRPQLRDGTSLRRFCAIAASVNLKLRAARTDLAGGLFRRPHGAWRIGVRTLQRLALASPVPHDLAVDPGIGGAQSVQEHGRRRPPELLTDEPIIRVAAPNSGWALDVALYERLTGNARHNIHQPVNTHHFIGTDVDRSSEIGAQQPQRALQAFIDVEEGTGLLPIPPDLDFTAVWRHRNFATNRGGSLLLAVIPAPLGTKNVVVARDADFQAMIAAIREVEPLAEQLLPTVFTVRCGRIGSSTPRNSDCQDRAGCTRGRYKPRTNKKSACCSAHRQPAAC